MKEPTAAKIIGFINRLEIRDPTSTIYDAIKDQQASQISPDEWAEMADLSIQAQLYVHGDGPRQIGKIGELAFCRRAMNALRDDPEVRMQVGQYLRNRAIEIESENEQVE